MKTFKYTIMILLVFCCLMFAETNADAKKQAVIIKNGTLKEYSGSAIVYTVPANVKKISPKAFCKAKKLKKVIVTKNVKKIDFQVFCDAKKLEKIIVDKNNKFYASYKGVLYDKKLKEILIIPEAIKKLVPAKKSIINSDFP